MLYLIFLQDKHDGLRPTGYVGLHGNVSKKLSINITI